MRILTAHVIESNLSEILQSKTEDRSSKNVILALKVLGKINTLKKMFIKHLQRVVM